MHKLIETSGPVGSFEDYYNTESSVLFAFGRYNPPTTGHQQVIDVVGKNSNKAGSAHIIPTASQNNKKDPLSIDEKIEILSYMTPDGVEVMNIKKLGINTWFDLMGYFWKNGINKIYQVAGSDRIGEFEKLFNQYNGKPDKSGNLLYHFPEGSYELISSGERDPDSDDVSGMSASKLRELAVQGEHEQFMLGMSPSVPNKVKEHTYSVIKSRLT